MKVVFLEEVEGTARTGDVKNVANGFARNYLLPRKLAAPATDHYISIAEAKATKEARRQDRLDEEARDRLLPKVDGKSIRIEVRVGEQGKLFGSVTSRDIAELLQESTRVELEHRQIDLKEPIRDLGVHEVTVKLTRNVLATVSVSVEPLGGLAPVEEETAELADEDQSAPEDVAPEAEAIEASESEAEEAAVEETEPESQAGESSQDEAATPDADETETADKDS
jgi:large subunit ribosomal protein L9